MSAYQVITLVVISLSSFAAGCATSPASKFYTLSPVQMAERRSSVKLVALSIGPVTIPELVDRPQIVSPINANRVFIDEFARWADPLKSQIGRTLAADLAQLLPGSVVSVYPQRASDNECRVSIDVQSFDSPIDSGVATLVVNWSVRVPKGNAVDGRSVVREVVKGPDYDALVSAYSRALAAAANDIATATLAALSQ